MDLTSPETRISSGSTGSQRGSTLLPDAKRQRTDTSSQSQPAILPKLTTKQGRVFEPLVSATVDRQLLQVLMGIAKRYMGSSVTPTSQWSTTIPADIKIIRGLVATGNTAEFTNELLKRSFIADVVINWTKDAAVPDAVKNDAKAVMEELRAITRRTYKGERSVWLGAPTSAPSSPGIGPTANANNSDVSASKVQLTGDAQIDYLINSGLNETAAREIKTAVEKYTEKEKEPKKKQTEILRDMRARLKNHPKLKEMVEKRQVLSHQVFLIPEEMLAKMDKGERVSLTQVK